MERDVYYRKAKSEGYRARSAYKLLELVDKCSLLEGVHRAIDLCAAPGSWSQVLSHALPEASIVAVDIQDIEPIAGVSVIKGDITSEETAQKIASVLKDKADIVLCDGAPEVTGLHDLDEYFQAALINASCRICQRFLRQTGVFVTKVFTGNRLSEELIADLRKHFSSVTIIKPRSSRTASKEAFAVCRGLLSPEAESSSSNK
ncbi:tRNA (cytidine32/guanosine34-2'-O)-methyltransferase [Nematocida sp. AWRm77]|nr:tRNA (cytidine32/guanosine34-2'-O)-methyltransferase [Nematocida sp. AWRm77]